MFFIKFQEYFEKMYLCSRAFMNFSEYTETAFKKIAFLSMAVFELSQ